MKQTIISTYNYLSKDSVILSLLGLSSASPEVIEDRISKTRQIGTPNDDSRRLAIWEDKEIEINRRVNRHTLVIDIIVTLQDQTSSGVALRLLGEVKRVLDKRPVGTKLKFQVNNSDLPIGLGWYKAQARFYYNQVGK
jgi:hypothetical protein